MDDITNGKLIRHWRVKLGLTQEKLATLANASREAVSQWENEGNGITETRLRPLVAAMGLTMAEFYSAEADLVDAPGADPTPPDEKSPLDTMAAG